MLSITTLRCASTTAQLPTHDAYYCRWASVPQVGSFKLLPDGRISGKRAQVNPHDVEEDGDEEGAEDHVLHHREPLDERIRNDGSAYVQQDDDDADQRLPHRPSIDTQAQPSAHEADDDDHLQNPHELPPVKLRLVLCMQHVQRSAVLVQLEEALLALPRHLEQP